LIIAVKIDLTELLRQVGNEADIVEEEKVSYPDDGLTLTKPVKIDLHLLNTGASVFLNGTIETEAELECARCLKKFRRPIIAKLAEEYVKPVALPPAKKVKEAELREEDFVYPIGQDNTLDLDETVRQNLMLSLPIKTLCREACEGV
jgi:uncharacterized protein